MDPLVTLSTLLAIASVGECIVWMVFACRSFREWRATPFLVDALRDVPADLPTMTVVIPAHNEERVAAACARSVLASD